MKKFSIKIKNKRQAFSLIELLIVIAVIGILVAVILPNLIGMRERARDTVRKNDLNQLKKALRLYFDDFGAYPSDTGGGSGSGDICCDADPASCVAGACGTNFEINGTSYMKALPDGYSYDQRDGGYDFLLSIDLENASDQDLVTSAERCGETPSNTYYVCAD
jgi:prepilin-type N-terminal cleavage/methylation domain-containing protein